MSRQKFLASGLVWSKIWHLLHDLARWSADVCPHGDALVGGMLALMKYSEMCLLQKYFFNFYFLHLCEVSERGKFNLAKRKMERSENDNDQ